MLLKNRRKEVKEQKKNLFIWGHRYIRLHKELLADDFYKDMYNKFRCALIENARKKLGGLRKSKEEYGKWIDDLADIYNRDHAEEVNKFAFILEEMREVWKPDLPKLRL